MKENLTDLEIVKIESFCKDEVMFEAVKKVLLAELYSHGVIEKGFKHNPLQNGAFSLASLSVGNPIPDEQLGQHIRGMWAGINMLHNGYEKLQTIKSEKEIVIDDIVNIAE
jgi:hypothetical protein